MNRKKKNLTKPQTIEMPFKQINIINNNFKDEPTHLPSNMKCPCGGDIWKIQTDGINIIYKCGDCLRLFIK